MFKQLEYSSLYHGAGYRSGYGLLETASGPSSLLTGLNEYWALSADGSSVGPTLLDSVGSVAFVSKGIGAPTNLPGNVASFNGTNYFIGDDTTTLGLTGAFSFSFWFKADTGLTHNVMISKNLNVGEILFELHGTNAVLSFSDAFADIPLPYAANVWHHVVTWWDGVDTFQYASIDGGVAVPTEFAGNPVTWDNTTFAIGADDNGDEKMVGLMSTVAAWSRALNSSERSHLFNGGDAAVYPFTGL